jgi:hypothetical protein
MIARGIQRWLDAVNATDFWIAWGIQGKLCINKLLFEVQSSQL